MQSHFSWCIPLAAAALLLGSTSCSHLYKKKKISVSVQAASQLEGNSGSTLFTFDVRLSKTPLYSTITVDCSTADGTATAGEDYRAKTETLVFNPGTASLSFTVAVYGDGVFENDETFSVSLSNPTAAKLDVLKSQATGTILNDDYTNVLSVADLSQDEGDSGTTQFTFNVVMSEVAQQTVTVDCATADGTAAAGDDYAALSRSLVFTPGITSLSFTVSVYGDIVPEPDEAFYVIISNPTNASIIDDSAGGIIRNDDIQPEIRISDTIITEGDSGTTLATFDVTLSFAGDYAVTADCSTSDMTAAAGVDYTAKTQTLTFPVGTTSLSFTVAVLGDNIDESDETFAVLLSNISYALPGDINGTGAILDNDATPGISISGGTVPEGDSGDTTLPFAVTLTNLSSQAVTADCAVSGGSATDSADFSASDVTVSIPAGSLSATFTVRVHGDTDAEPDETVEVSLSNANGAIIADSSATGVISNDDGAVPQLSIAAPAPVLEGDSASTSLTFTVTLSPVSTTSVTVDYSTSNVTAAAGEDYTADTGTLTFTPGNANLSVTVTINGDTAYENDETFTVNLSNPNNAAISSSQAVGTITNDDAVPVMSISDVSAQEGDFGITSFTFTVTLSNPSGTTVTVDAATSDSTAAAGSDYTSLAETLVFAPGQTSASFTVDVLADTAYELDETFNVTLSNASGATIGTAAATGTIVNDDPVPTISISGVTTSEGNSGTTNFDFTVQLSNAGLGMITVDCDTADGTALAGLDYIATSQTLTFNPGDVQQTFTVQVTGETRYETNETFTATLSNASGASIATATATGTIINDDTLPGLSINDLSLSEGDFSNTVFTFTVSLSETLGSTITLKCSTSDGTAVAGSDYAAKSEMLTIPQGTLSQSFTVVVTGEISYEDNEYFDVILSDPVNALIIDGTGRGTIVNDDMEIPTISISDAEGQEGDSGSSSLIFNLSLSHVFNHDITVTCSTGDLSGTSTPATASDDYEAKSEIVTIPAGSLSATFSVTVYGDEDYEPDEQFAVTLSNPSFVTIKDGDGVGSIQNDDPVPPTLYISDVTRVEGNSGISLFTFTVGLSPAATEVITVTCSTEDGTASGGSDYQGKSEMITFNVGETSKEFTVSVYGDKEQEGNETFNVRMTGMSGVLVGHNPGIGTIREDDAPVPTVSINDVVRCEGDVNEVYFRFLVSLSNTYYSPVSITCTTADSTATAGNDYEATSQTLVFTPPDHHGPGDPGVTLMVFTVPVYTDITHELSETFVVYLSDPVNCTIGDGRGVGVLANDDSGVIIYVDGNASGNDNGSNWADAFTNLPYALWTAQPGDKIWVAEGTYQPNYYSSSLYRTDTFGMKPLVSMFGGFAGTETSLDQRDFTSHETILDGSYWCYHVVTGINDATLDGFTISGGLASGAGAETNGAGIYVDGSTFQALDIDGYSVDYRQLTVNRCIVRNNVAGRHSTPAINGTGAGMYITSTPADSEVTVTNSLFYDNDAADYAGAVYIDSSYAVFANCTIAGNSADNAGALFFNNSSPYFLNTIIWSNFAIVDTATDLADNIYVTNISNPTLSYCDYPAGTPSVYVETNSLIWGGSIHQSPQFANTSAGTWSLSPTYISATDRTVFEDASASWAVNSLVGYYINPNILQQKRFLIIANTATTITVSGNLTGTVVAGDAYEIIRDYHLSIGSPCINAGASVDYTPADDLDGYTRNNPDIGAYEYH